jgi:hypothetical protein
MLKENGYPYIIALGKKITQDPPLYEIVNLDKNEQLYLSENSLLDYIQTHASSSSSSGEASAISI